MSDRSLSELANAEIVPNMGGPNGWLLRFGEEDYDTVNKSGRNTVLVNTELSISDSVSYGGIMVDFDLENDEISLHNGSEEVRVPEDRHEHVLWSVYDEDGPRLNDIFDELYVPTVREGLMDQFMPRFRRQSSEVQKVDDGWLVDGDILVSWDGSNHPVNVAQTHVVNGNDTVEADEDKEARDVDMPSGWTQTDEFHVTAPDGRTFTLDSVELKFLTTVGLILGRNADNYDDDLFHTIGNASITGFTDTRSGLHHNHGLNKHRLDDLGVTDEAQEKLYYNSHDHAGVWEMAVREQELQNVPFSVFEDAENDNSSKWSKIQSTKEKAPIPKHVRSNLEDMFE